MHTPHSAWISAFADALSTRTGKPSRAAEAIAQTWYGVFADLEPDHAVQRWMMENAACAAPAPLPPTKPYVMPKRGPSAGTLDTVRQAFNRPVTKK